MKAWIPLNRSNSETVQISREASPAPSANVPGYFSFWPHWGHRAPVSSGRSRGLSGSSTLLLHTCPGSGIARPSYLTAWPRRGGLFPKPENKMWC